MSFFKDESPSEIFEVNYYQDLSETFERRMDEIIAEAGSNKAHKLFESSEYFYNNNLSLTKAYDWVNESIEISNHDSLYVNYFLKAKISASLGDSNEATSNAFLAIEFGDLLTGKARIKYFELKNEIDEFIKKLEQR